MAPTRSTRLVLVHGTRLSGTQWAPYAGRFGDLEVSTPDLPGHGARIGEPFTTAAAVAAIDEAVRAGVRPGGGSHRRLEGPSRPEGPVVLVGHSLGGYMAAAYAAAHPTTLAGLVLVGASAVPHGPGATAYRLLGTVLQRAGDARAGAVANRVIAQLAGRDVLSAVVAGGTSYEATTAAWEAVCRDCRPEQLAEVECPVLVVGGQFDQLAIHARRYAAAARKARVVIVPRATHFLPLTHMDELTAIVRDFVTEVASDT